MKKATVICDLQFGSTGKGLIAGYLAEKESPDVVVTAWGANAGHTYIMSDGRKFVHTMLANGIVSPALKYVLIGPGSMLNISNLIKEIDECRDLLKGVEILVHPQACVIHEWHRVQEEKSMTAIGSTKKGVGAALVDKIKRDPGTMATAGQTPKELQKEWKNHFRVCSHEEYLSVIASAGRVLVEGAQGYSLGINSGFYPYVTSRECTLAQILSDTLVPYSLVKRVVGSMRTYPIRVANRYDADGVQVGWSGPCYKDQEEIEWDSIGIEPELTTVTQLPRRIFSFSMIQIVQACWASSVTDIFANFINYLPGKEQEEFMKLVQSETGTKISYAGYGPTFDDIKEL